MAPFPVLLHTHFPCASMRFQYKTLKWWFLLSTAGMNGIQVWKFRRTLLYRKNRRLKSFRQTAGPSLDSITFIVLTIWLLSVFERPAGKFEEIFAKKLIKFYLAPHVGHRFINLLRCVRHWPQMHWTLWFYIRHTYTAISVKLSVFPPIIPDRKMKKKKSSPLCQDGKSVHLCVKVGFMLLY